MWLIRASTVSSDGGKGFRPRTVQNRTMVRIPEDTLCRVSRDARIVFSFSAALREVGQSRPAVAVSKAAVLLGRGRSSQFDGSSRVSRKLGYLFRANVAFRGISYRPETALRYEYCVDCDPPFPEF